MNYIKVGKELVEYFQEIVFDEPSHTYKVKGKGLTPVSNFIKGFVKPFNAKDIAPGTARKEGISVKKVLQNWDNIRIEACNNGTMVHDSLERYIIDRYKIFSNLKFDSVNQHLKNNEEPSNKEKAGIKFLNNKPIWYVPISTELRMYCTDIGIAGTADMIFLDTRDNTLCIGDWKTNKDLFKNYKNQKLLGIFNDLNDMPYSKYVIQLSMYKILLEKTGYKVSRHFLVWLRKDGNYELFDTPDVTDRLNKYLLNKTQYADW